MNTANNMTFVHIGNLHVNLSVAGHREPEVVRIGIPRILSVRTNGNILCILAPILFGEDLDVGCRHPDREGVSDLYVHID